MKRFTLMMMVLCFLMCIPLKMMAETVTIHYIINDGWADVYAYVYKNGGGPILGEWPGRKCTDIKTVGDKKVATWTLDLGDVAAKDALIIFTNNAGAQTSANGFPVINNQYYNYSGTANAPSEGGGESGGGDTPTPTPAPNLLTGRVYTQGYYLAGNFFNFSANKVTYDDAVFKFQEQKNDDEGNAVYRVEIPASLTAHAQVMSVDEFGKPQKVYGPGSACGISYTCPETGLTKEGQLALAGSDPKTFGEGTNYWDIKTRNESAAQYSDGMYEVFITVNKTTGEPTKWQFKHIGNKRVAFFISDAKNATAMPVYDTYEKNTTRFSNKFFASVNLSAEHSYYVTQVSDLDFKPFEHTL